MNGERLSTFVGQPDRPLIIGGCPRSGTTLLRTMLQAGPEVAIPRETRFVLETWRERRRFGDLRDADNRRRLARWIFTREETEAHRLGLEADDAVERLVASRPALGSMLTTCFVMFAEKHEKPRWGDKRPLYAARMSAIWDLFPNAHFIHVVRDPRACVASLRTLGWFEGEIAPMAALWEHSVKSVAGWRSRLAPDQLLDVKYEELVLDAQRTLRRVAEFAGLRADDDAVEQMLRYQEVEEKRSRRHHSNLTQPLDASRVSGWKKTLEPREIAFIEQATRPLMERWSYEPVSDGVAAPAELLRGFTKQRRRYAAAQLKLDSKERLQKLLGHCHPLSQIRN
jgi:Sulfotransferase family